MMRQAHMLTPPCTTLYRHAAHAFDLVDPMARASVITVTCPGWLQSYVAPERSESADQGEDQDAR